MFGLLLSGHLSRHVHNSIRILFGRRLDLDSMYKLYKRIANLAPIHKEQYDCCVNSCCCYTGKLTELVVCPHCKESRFDDLGRPRQIFRYIPLAPRLQALFLNSDMVATLDYRATYLHAPGVISDVFDGSHYQDLCDETVVVDGLPQRHQFFFFRIIAILRLDIFLMASRYSNDSVVVRQAAGPCLP